MGEKPIIFSGPMVLAILDGRKTQTRRVVKPLPSGDIDNAGDMESIIDMATGRQIRCPYGAPGGWLWVRETFAWASPENQRDSYCYKADLTDDQLAEEKAARKAAPQLCKAYKEYRWRPPIHMPRDASRITLKIVGIRVERLQAISEADAKAEGCEPSNDVEMRDGSPCYTIPYQRLWTQINGIDNPAAWERNPWVWVVEFKRASK